ncbi:MAG TPA: hypothetical protein DDZ80_19165 [Cyanobacteria bacterium UBA8803]|nr:hypothetical protein [Cyanobacteria bacterium UBA9273]HBL60494.1 hypothetical protein [Cyanobacteria bacterium UBA8803]
MHNISHWGDLIGNSPLDWLVLAQQVNDPDVLGRMQRAFKNFIDSGQVWALLIGLVAGYVFRGMTSY